MGAWVRYPPGTRQCSGSMTFCCRARSADPCLRLMDPDPDPAIFVIELQDASKKLVLYHNFFCLLLLEGTFTLFFKDKKSKRVTKYCSRIQDFSYYFCMIIRIQSRIRVGIHTSDYWIRIQIRKAKKYVDPDLEHCHQGQFICPKSSVRSSNLD